MKAYYLLLSLLGASTVTNAFLEPKPNAIFTEDNRQELYTTSDDWQDVGNAIAGKVSLDHITDHKAYWQLEGVPLNRRVCPETRFAEQVTVPNCTGFLVKPNILITAAHCMTKIEDCSQYLWVFGFTLKNETDLSYQKVNPDQVFHCKNVLARRMAEFGAVDYAVIELDRPVINRKPLVLGFHRTLEIGQTVAMIGHPSGLPLKLTDGASIINITDRSIETDLDLFHGNSGSPVFDANSKEVIGITSSGHADYIRDEEKLCKTPKICKPEDNCYLSLASRVTNLLVEPIFIGQKNK